MIATNLSPAQLASLKVSRPQSASLRTPRGRHDASFDRLRDGQATPRAAPKPAAAPEEEEVDQPWLFRFPRSLSTADIWKMGFSRAVVFNGNNWTTEGTAAADILEAFHASSKLPGLAAEHKDDLESAIGPAFLRGDVLISVQCAGLGALDDAAVAWGCVSKLVDAVSNVWTLYDEMEEGALGAVVMVLEGCDMSKLYAAWGADDAAVEYPVALLDEEFSAFFDAS